jgi:3-dehydroquinate synthase
MKMAQVNQNKITIHTPSRTYDVLFSEKIFSEISGLVSDKHVSVISDSNISRLYLESLLSELKNRADNVLPLVFKAGEKSKSIRTCSRFIEKMAENGMGRDSVIIAIGGGITLDISGFIAGTFMRGIDYYSLPTSLLAMVDACAGGKTGLNIRWGKNLIGSFHQPSGVFIYLKFLETLPEIEWKNGFAEMIKHAVIADETHFDELEKYLASGKSMRKCPLRQWIQKSISIKAGIVEKDEKEMNIRSILNFGHTVGHGIEKASNHRISHGTAVALGMICEANLSSFMGFFPMKETERIRNILRCLNFPDRISSIKPETIMNFIKRDKKTRREKTRLALPVKIGKMYSCDGSWTVEVREKDLKKALEVVCSA